MLTTPIDKGGEILKADTLTVLVVEPEQPPYVKNIGGSLHSLQIEVGGSIEAILTIRLPLYATRKAN